MRGLDPLSVVREEMIKCHGYKDPKISESEAHKILTNIYW